MHESTQISHGDGSVNIIFESQSTTDIAAPVIRAGSYSDILECCFTQKELETIEAGNNAEVVFTYVMSDERSAPELFSQFIDEVQNLETNLGDLTEGIIIEVSASKTLSDQTTDLDTLYQKFEMQIELPLYLKNIERQYFVLANNMGEYELMEDVDIEADTLSISTDSIGSYLILYKDIIPGEERKTLFSYDISIQHIFITAIIALGALWFLIDRLHKRS